MREMLRYSALAVLVALVAACDKVPLLAPANSQITLSANTLVVPTGGTTGLTAFVTESSGTPVQNGTTVRFTTTLGTVSPSEVQTTNGLAVATFNAGSSSGVAEVHAISGGATGTTSGSGSTASTANVVKITIGAAAVKTVTLRANPGTVGPGGGSVELIASVLTTDGTALPNIPVTFNADRGTLSVQTVPTDTNGEARTVLRTSEKTTVSATAGTVTSSTTTVDVRVGPGLSITCKPTGTATTCAAVQASSSNNTAAVVFTVTRAANASNTSATINFGDGTSQSLGNFSGASTDIAHTYTGPSGSSPAVYTATVTATDSNGDTATAATNVTITARASLTVELKATPSSAVAGEGEVVSFEAIVSGGDAVSYTWHFGDGSSDITTALNKTSHVYDHDNKYTATVTVTTTDGRTATGRAEFIVSGIGK